MNKIVFSHIAYLAEDVGLMRTCTQTPTYGHVRSLIHFTPPVYKLNNFRKLQLSNVAKVLLVSCNFNYAYVNSIKCLNMQLVTFMHIQLSSIFYCCSAKYAMLQLSIRPSDVSYTTHTKLSVKYHQIATQHTVQLSYYECTTISCSCKVASYIAIILCIIHIPDSYRCCLLYSITLIHHGIQ